MSATFSSDVKTLHVCKQQQIALSTKLVFHDILDSNRLVVVWMTIRLDTHVCHSLLLPDPATIQSHAYKKQIASGNKVIFRTG